MGIHLTLRLYLHPALIPSSARLTCLCSVLLFSLVVIIHLSTKCQWMQTTTVSWGGELPTRPGVKGQRFISQLSGDASLATEWHQVCAHRALSVGLRGRGGNHKPFSKILSEGLLLVKCAKPMLISQNDTYFPLSHLALLLVMQLYWQLSINEASINTAMWVQGCWVVSTRLCKGRNT